MNFYSQNLKQSCSLALFALSGAILNAQEEGTPVDNLEAFSVIGSKENVFELQGSGYFLESTELDIFKSTDITSIFRTIPGVYVRPEEGYGLFPNISLRGVDSGRSKKVTIMEDGILSSPSPFSDPSAYYSPTAGRMSGFEVLKGSSQVKHGPNTTGGVINYISTPIPESRETNLSLRYGSEAEIIGHLTSGGQVQKEKGKFGYLVEVFHHTIDGWKELDTVSLAGTPFAALGSNDTGFEKTDYMVKFSWAPNDNRHYYEFKAGYTELDGDIGYTGLSAADFAANPYHRYAMTRFDNMASDHTRVYLRHLFNISDQTKLTSSIFYNKFNRDWYKISKINGTSLSTTALEDPTILDTLNGIGAGNITVKHNDRTYTVRGIQSKINHEVGNHNIEGGFRFTDDVYDNNPYTEDLYDLSDYSVTATSKSGSTRDSQAWEFYVQDTLSIGNLNVTPGIRHTTVDFDYRGVESDIQVTTPGISFDYSLSTGAELFGGYFKGQALPGPSGRSNGDREETSDSFEIGYRKIFESSLYYEFVGYFTNFENMLATESLGTGTVDRNFGEASTHGIEMLGGYNFGTLGGITTATPFTLTATYTKSEFDTATDGSDFWAGAEDGNRFPYIPEWQFNARLGFIFENTDFFVNYQWVDEVYTDAANTGAIDSYGLVDLSITHYFNEKLNLFGRVSNFTDEEYATTRLPAGLRAGAPRLYTVGVDYTF